MTAATLHDETTEPYDAAYEAYEQHIDAMIADHLATAACRRDALARLYEAQSILIAVPGDTTDDLEALDAVIARLAGEEPNDA